MKIAQIVSTPPFAWTTGGPARAVFELSKSLVERDHDVTILTTNMFHGDKSDGSKKAQESIDGIRFKYFKVLGGYLAWKYKIYFSPGLIRYLKIQSTAYDVIHLQDLISFQAVATSIYCKKNKVPYILTPHGCMLWLGEPKILNRLYYRLFGAKLLENAYKIIALTSTEKKEFMQLSVPEEKIVIIPNGVTISDYENLPEIGQFRSKYKIGDQEKMVLFLGRVHKIKGIDLLVDAFSDLVKEYPEVKLVIAGRDEGFLTELQQQANKLNLSEKIIFTGPLTEEEKNAAYVDADVYVLPSVHEGFPITVLEAWACGTPVIVTKGCNISDIVENNGIVVDNNRSQLKTALVMILTDNKLKNFFIRQGLERITTEYNWNRIAEKIEILYNECSTNN